MVPEKEYNARIQELEAKVRLLERELLSYKEKGSESTLRRAELASRSGNWELHLDTGKMHGSDGAMILYGLKNSDIEYEAIKEIPLPEYRPLLDSALNELISENKPYNIEFKIRNAERGNIIDIHSTAEYDKKNKKVFGIIRDITKQKNSEEQIRMKSQELAILLEITLKLLERADRRTVLQNILEGAKKLVALDTGAIYAVDGRTLILESTIPPLPDDFPDEFRRAQLGNHPHIAKAIEIGMPVIIPDVTEIKLSAEEKVIVSHRNMRSLMFIPLIASGQCYGVIVLGTLERIHHFNENEISISRTISNIASLAMENSILIANLKSARDKAEESDKLKTAFLHNISHEIRTPLNAIIGFSGFLDQPGLEESEKKKYVEIIQQSNNQLLNIINDIFNVSHIEAGQVLLKEEATNICSVLSNLIEQFLPECEKKGLELKLELNNLPEEGCRINTDEVKLTQVLSNLLSNAVKFTARGHIILGCAIESDGVSFFVEDTGIGIPESELSKVFNRFYQVDKSVSRAYSGAGLGLSISDAYIRLMGGAIKLDSTVGKGSRFSFKIPCIVPHAFSDQKPKNKTAEIHSSGKQKTILIADDERSSFLLLELFLKSLNAKILHAANGSEALDLCRSEMDIDLLLMDIKMPVMDGYKAAEEIKKIRPELVIIVQTAYNDIMGGQKNFGSVYSDFITKPIDKEQLLELVGRYLS